MKSNRVDKEAMNMEIPKIHESEYRFCLIMWEHEPVTAVELVKLCQDQLGWKRTTTYTVIKTSWRAWCAEERQWHCYFSRFQR